MSATAGYSATLTVSEDLSDLCRELTASLGNLRAVWDDVGSALVVSTQQRFEGQSDPLGKPWTPLSEATKQLRFKALLGKRAAVTKRGKATKAATRAQAAVAAGMILQWDGHLKGGISYRAADDGVEVGTDRVYGRIQQLGGPSKGFIKSTIPARPYLPDFTGSDAQVVIDSLSTYLDRAIAALPLGGSP